MTPTCNCDHPRSEHDGGNVALKDYRTGSCNHQGCTCKQYHPDKATRKRKDEILLASCTIPAIIGLVSLVGFALAWFMVDLALSDYTILAEFEYKKFQNGTEVPRTNPLGIEIMTPKERLAWDMKMIIGMIIFFAGMLSGTFYGMSYYENRYFQLIRGGPK